MRLAEIYGLNETKMYRGLRGIDRDTLVGLIGSDPDSSGVVDVKRSAGRGHRWWSTNPRIAMTYASTPSSGETSSSGYIVLLSAEVPGGSTPTGKIGAVTDPRNAVIDRVAYTDSGNGDELLGLIDA